MFRLGSTHKTILSLAAAVTLTTPVVVLADASNPEALSWARQKPTKKAAPRRVYRAKAIARPAAAPRPVVPAQPVPEALSYAPPPPPVPVAAPAYAPAIVAAQPAPAYAAAAPLAVTAVQGGTNSLLYALLGAIIGAGAALLIDDNEDHIIVIDTGNGCGCCVCPPPPASP